MRRWRGCGRWTWRRADGRARHRVPGRRRTAPSTSHRATKVSEALAEGERQAEALVRPRQMEEGTGGEPAAHVELERAGRIDVDRLRAWAVGAADDARLLVGGRRSVRSAREHPETLVGRRRTVLGHDLQGPGLREPQVDVQLEVRALRN